MVDVNSFKKYLKEDSSEIVFAFGRFNPPTIGHEKLIDAVKKLARGGTYRIYPSQTQDTKVWTMVSSDIGGAGSPNMYVLNQATGEIRYFDDR